MQDADTQTMVMTSVLFSLASMAARRLRKMGATLDVEYFTNEEDTAVLRSAPFPVGWDE